MHPTAAMPSASATSSPSSSPSRNPTALLLNASSPLAQSISCHLLSNSYHVVTSHSNVSLGHTLSATTGPDACFLATDFNSWISTVGLFQSARAWFTSKAKGSSRNREIDVLIIFPPETHEDGGENLLGELLAPDVRIENDELQLDTMPSGPPETRAVTEAVTNLIWATRLFANGMGPESDGQKARKVIVFADGAELSGVPGMPVYGAATHAIVGLTRSLGFGLAAAASIELNSILPAFVRSSSGISPASMGNVISAVDMLLGTKDCWTTAMAGAKTLSGNRDCAGQVLEVAMEGVYWRRQADWPDEEQRWMGEERAAFFHAAKGRPQN